MALECFRDRGLLLAVAYSGRCHVPLGIDRKANSREPESSHLCFFESITTIMSGVAALHVQPGPRNSMGCLCLFPYAGVAIDRPSKRNYGRQAGGSLQYPSQGCRDVELDAKQ
jgi:hypothetical protein